MEDPPSPEELELPSRRRERPGRRRNRRPKALVLVWLVVVAAVFLVGLAVGMAIQEAPRPGGEQTIVRTLVPATVGPPDTVTVTVEVG